MKTNRVSSLSINRCAIRPRSKATTSAFLQIKNVLVPTDFSAASLQAVEYALPLMEWFGANLHLVHVSEPDYPLANMAGMPLVLPECDISLRVQRHLQRVARKYSIQTGRENIHALKGRPFEEICHLSQIGRASC